MPIILISIYKSVPNLPIWPTPRSRGFKGVANSFLAIDPVTGSFARSLIWGRGRDSVIESSYRTFTVQVIFIGFWSAIVFTVQDLLLFYIGFESVLIPLYLLITLYGTRNRKIHASYMFFIYTQIGSQFQFQSLLGQYIEDGTSEYKYQQSKTVTNTAAQGPQQQLIWLSFFISFAVKLPMYGVHTWLLQAHVEAPTAASVLLAAILQKMGSYGLIRYSISLFPQVSNYYKGTVIILCLISLLFPPIAAQSQTDMKVIIAYSSICHMGTSTLALFTSDIIGIEASIFFLISHAMISSALFFQVGVLYERYHSRTMFYYRGLVQIYPTFIIIQSIFSQANCAIPMSSGFIGEFLAQTGTFNLNPFIAFLAGLSVVQVPSFMLNLVHRVSYGRFTFNMPMVTSDITKKEFNVFFSLMFFTFLLGVYPQLVLDEIIYPSLTLLTS